MTKLTMATVMGLTVLGATAHADVSILDNKVTQTVDCAKDPVVSILGNEATITLTGACTTITLNGNSATVTGSAAKVIVNGNKNTATLDGTDSLIVNGNENTITWKRTLDSKLKKPKQITNGKKNSVAKS